MNGYVINSSRMKKIESLNRSLFSMTIFVGVLLYPNIYMANLPVSSGLLMLITFASSLGPGQVQQNVRPKCYKYIPEEIFRKS